MTPRSRTARLSGFALAGALALGLAACSSDATVEPANESDAGDQQEQLDPAAVVQTSLDTLDETSYSLALTAGDFSSGEMTHDPSAQAYHAFTSVDASAAGSMGTVEAEVIGIGQDVWIKPTGGVTNSVPEFQDVWIHTTAQGTPSLVGMDLKQLTDQLFDSLSNIEQVDEYTYTADVDTHNVSQLPSSAPITVTVVLDDRGRLVELTGEMPDPTDASQTVPATITVTGYGEPVDVSAPPADQVLELDDLDFDGF